MIEMVLPDIYRMEIELPHNPLRSLNSYVIKGKDRDLIIDTGMNRKECVKAFIFSLQELEIDLKRADLFVTHMHADHSGLVSLFNADTNRIFCHPVDAQVINAMCQEHFWEEMRAYAKLNGFPEEELTDAIDRHPGHKYCNKQKINFDFVQGNSEINIGPYSFRCVETPGHTQGHLCLYEANYKMLISGDHILQDISPTIMLWDDTGNPLQQYLHSLFKVSLLDVDWVLPGHRGVFRGHRQRIKELIEHHQDRAAEALEVLKHGPQNAYYIASRMTWDIKCTCWEEFPPQQKLFACSEVLAHLQFLWHEGKVVKDTQGKGIVYRRD